METHDPLAYLSDEHLVQRCKEGDRTACDVLFHRYRHMVYGLVRATNPDPEWVEDTAGDVFRRILESLHSFRGDSLFGTWVRGVVLNTLAHAIGEVQKHRREVGLTEDSAIDDRDLTQLVAEKELQARALGRLAQLPDNYRRTLILRLWECFTYQEIADRLGVATGTVKSRISRAIRDLRRMEDD